MVEKNTLEDVDAKIAKLMKIYPGPLLPLISMLSKMIMD
jgi:hypothetical protein